MGEKSREKKERRERERRRPDLERKLREQYDLLTAHAEAFDRGRRVVALSLAVTIRVLVHDTAQSKSLLRQLDLKDKLRFRDTAQHIDPRNLLPNPALVHVKVTPGHGVEWEAPLNMRDDDRLRQPLPFRQWWTMPLTKDHTGGTWSRKDFVLHLANKEGGAHIDPAEIDERLRQIEDENAMGWTYADPVLGEVPMPYGPILPSVRQIAHEVATTLTPVIDSLSPPRPPAAES